MNVELLKLLLKTWSDEGPVAKKLLVETVIVAWLYSWHKLLVVNTVPENVTFELFIIFKRIP